MRQYHYLLVLYHASLPLYTPRSVAITTSRPGLKILCAGRTPWQSRSTQQYRCNCFVCSLVRIKCVLELSNCWCLVRRILLSRHFVRKILVNPTCSSPLWILAQHRIPARCRVRCGIRLPRTFRVLPGSRMIHPRSLHQLQTTDHVPAAAGGRVSRRGQDHTHAPPFVKG